jgi:hypothetical protein
MPVNKCTERDLGGFIRCATPRYKPLEQLTVAQSCGGTRIEQGR